MDNTKTIINKILQAIIAIVFGIIISFVFLVVVGEYCVTIFEANTGYGDPKLNNYYSQIAKFPIMLPAIIFAVINFIIFKMFLKSYKVFAITYISITMLICLATLLFTNTDIVRGI